MTELPKTFDPKSIEERWYAHWESRGLFRPDRPDAKPEWFYVVRFTMADLWDGYTGTATDALSTEIPEHWLAPVP